VCLQEDAKDFEVSFIPRPLIDDVEDRFRDEWGRQLNEVRKESKKVDKDIEELNKKLKNHEDRLSNPKLSDVDRQDLKKDKDLYALQLSEKKKKKEDIENRLPKFFSDMRQATIENRRHRWNWILDKVEDKDVTSIRNQIEKVYNLKKEEYKKKVTLESFRNQFSLALAKAHDRGSIAVAHAVKKLEVPDGYEFDHINFYGEEDIDEFLTILINAIGLRKPKLRNGERYSFRKLE
jgi:hypothetical protein